jgi:hypothetical protein
LIVRRLLPGWWACVLTALAVAVPVVAEEDSSPAAAFAAFEQMLLVEPRLCIRFRIEATGALASTLEGRARFDHGHAPTTLLAKGEFGGETVDLSLLAARDDMWVQRAAAPDPIPPHLQEALVIGFTRMGLLHNLAMLTARQPPDHGEGGVQDWVKPVNVTGTGPYAFDILVAGQPSGSAVLHLDERGLPVRRTQSVEFPSGTMEVVEHYTRFELDCPTDL